jgi:Ca-activated chloride channel family protein
MKNKEKIYQKIKNASNKNEEISFPGMDKVWNRVEEKLDTKIIKKKSEVWKKLAIAASFLLFFTVGIQLYTTQKELNQPVEPKINIEPTTQQVQDNIKS